jgi:hypothetical protein
MTMKSDPSTSPKSSTATMFECRSMAEMRASSMNIATKAASPLNSFLIFLMQTSRATPITPSRVAR